MQKRAPLTSSALVDEGAVEGVRWREDLPCAQEFAFFLDLALGGAQFSHVPSIVLEKREDSGQSSISTQDTVNYPLTISRILADVEPQIREMGPEENQQYDRGLVHFSGILYRKGNREEADELFQRVHRGRALRSALQDWRLSVFLPALLTPHWNSKIRNLLNRVYTLFE
jgi:hypothetical protein